jgi:hypothetical protein
MNLVMTKNNVKDNKEKINELKSIIDGLGDLKSLTADIPNNSKDGTFDVN